MIKTKSQFAEIMGVHKSTVTRWGKVGRLVLAENGRVKVEESKALIKSTEGGRTDVAERHAQNRGQALPTQPQTQQAATELDESADMQASASEIGEDRAHYKAVALDSKNKLDKLADALSNGNRLHRDEQLQSISQLANDLKSGVERLIDNLAPQLTGLPEKERQQKIQNEIHLLIQQTA